jgi:pimeloyl-ACP methyl ester carboxylesterase
VLFRQSQQDAPAPPWFHAALNNKPEHTDIDVDGCRIHLRTWGQSDQLPLVFVHGDGAHAGWWDHIAPFFAGSHHVIALDVIALDLSGHGDSGFRDTYNLHTWAREVLAAAQSCTSGLPTIVGHSMGGWVGGCPIHYRRRGAFVLRARSTSGTR